MVADVDGVTREGEAWFRVDRERRHLEWGSEGPDNYHGYLDVSGDGATASVTVFLHTERAGSGDIDRGIADTLAEIKRLAEAARRPVPPADRPAAARQPDGGTAGGLSRRPSP